MIDKPIADSTAATVIIYTDDIWPKSDSET